MRAASVSASPRTKRRRRARFFLLCVVLLWSSLLIIQSQAFTLDEVPEGVLEEDDEKPEAMEPSTRAGAADNSKSLTAPSNKAVMKLPRLPAGLSTVQWSSVQRRANHLVVPSLIAVAVGSLVSLTAMGIRKLSALWPIIRRPETASASASSPSHPWLAWGLGLAWPGFLRRRSRESGLHDSDASTDLDLSGLERSSKSKAKANKDSQFQKLQAALRAKEEELVEAHRARGEELAGSRRTIETLKRDVDILISEKEDVARRMETMRRDHERQLEKVTAELRMARTSLERKKGDQKGDGAGDDTSLEAVEKRLSEQYQRMLEAERKIMADEAKSLVGREQAALEAEKARLQTIFEEEKARLQALFHQRLEEEVDVIRVRYEDELRSQLEAWKERCTDAVKANQEETQRRMMEYVQAREKGEKEQQ